MHSGMVIVRPAGAPGLNWVSTWDVTSFPRRGKKLRFRLYALKNEDQWETLADFRFPNPLPGPYPVWQAAKPPIAGTNGNLRINLTSLVSGTETVPYLDGLRPFTKASFETLQDGKPTDSWRPDHMDARDATGNEPLSPKASHGATNGLVYYEIQNMDLSPSEVWRLRMRFVNETATDDSHTWTSPELAVQVGSLVTMSLETNLQTSGLSLATTQPFQNIIRLKLLPRSSNTRVSLPTIVDNLGRRAEYEVEGFEDFGSEAQWKIPARAKWVKISMRLLETRNFEFIAQPTRQ